MKTFQEWYTSITVEGPMEHMMERAWNAAAQGGSQPAGTIRVSKGQLTGVDVPEGVILHGTYDLMPR